MITIIYFWAEHQQVYSDDEQYIIGTNCKAMGIKEEQFKTYKELENFIEDLTITEAESEGHEEFKILAIFDKETGWYDNRYVK